MLRAREDYQKPTFLRTFCAVVRQVTTEALVRLTLWKFGKVKYIALPFNPRQTFDSRLEPFGLKVKQCMWPIVVRQVC